MIWGLIRGGVDVRGTKSFGQPRAAAPAAFAAAFIPALVAMMCLSAAAAAPANAQRVPPGQASFLVLAQADMPVGEPAVRVLFEAGEGDALSPEAQGDLLQFAAHLQANPALRMQLLAYAGLHEHGPARRLSLTRALTVRAFLIDQGVGSARMNVRALGNTFLDGPTDRVDIFQVGQ